MVMIEHRKLAFRSVSRERLILSLAPTDQGCVFGETGVLMGLVQEPNVFTSGRGLHCLPKIFSYIEVASLMHGEEMLPGKCSAARFCMAVLWHRVCTCLRFLYVVDHVCIEQVAWHCVCELNECTV